MQPNNLPLLFVLGMMLIFPLLLLYRYSLGIRTKYKKIPIEKILWQNYAEEMIQKKYR